MDNNKDISYIVFEGEMARAERHIKRLWITLIVTMRDRMIMKSRLIDGLTFEHLAEKHEMSTRHIKRVVYKCEQQIFKHFHH